MASALGLIGLGNLGKEFGKRAVAASKRVVAYDVVSGLSLEGSERVGSIGSVVASGASTVVSIVPDDAAAMAVSEELLAHAKPGALHVSSSTISPECSRALSALHALAAGACYISPISP